MASQQPETPRPEKIFPVSWDQFHRDSRALAWRLHEAGPFEAIVCITRGGLVSAAIVARELNVRMIETVCVVSYRDYRNQGDFSVLKGIAPEVAALHSQKKTCADRRRPCRHRQHRAHRPRTVAGRAFRDRLRQADGPSARRHLRYRSLAGHLDLLSVGHRFGIPAADP